MSINLAELPSASAGYSKENIYKQICLLPQPHPLSLKLYLPSSSKREIVESFIHKQFKLKHGASIKHYMPYLLSLESCSGSVLSAAGFRQACDHRLFLEMYLDEPVEKTISKYTNEYIERSSLIEVGNLASDCPGSSRLMIMAMTCIFNQLEFKWVAMTGTKELANIFRNLRLIPIILVDAEASRLASERNEWGQYYSHCPQVMAGDIRYAHQQLCKSVHYQKFINSLNTFNLPPCSKKKSA